MNTDERTNADEAADQALDRAIARREAAAKAEADARAAARLAAAPMDAALALAGENGITAKLEADGKLITLERYYPASAGAPLSWKAYRPGPNDAPLLKATVSTTAEIYATVLAWTGARPKHQP